MAQDAFMAPGAFDADAEQIRRRMAFAQALQQQSAPPKGEMVGNRYVAPSWTQHASSLANALIGAGQERKAMQDFQALGERRREEGVADVGKFIDAMRGTPAQTFQPLTQNDDEGNAMPAAVKPAAGPDMVEALRIAQTSRNPMLNQAGGALLGSVMPKQPKWEKVEMPNPDGSKRVGVADMNAANPEATFRPFGVAPVKLDVVNGKLVNTYTGDMTGKEVPPQVNPANDLLIPDPNNPGKMIPNTSLIGVKTQLARAGASNNTNIINEGQKGFTNEMDLAKAFKSEPIYKDYNDMRSAYGQVKSSIKQGTPIGDVAAATKIMKLLDPGSVVRESELGIAMSAAGKLDRLQNYFDMYLKGNKLTPQQRTEFANLADELYNVAGQVYNARREEYAQQGKRYNLNTDLLGSPHSMPKPSAPTQPSSPAQPGQQSKKPTVSNW